MTKKKVAQAAQEVHHGEVLEAWEITVDEAADGKAVVHTPEGDLLFRPGTEPLVRDLELADFLGFTRLRDIRRLIERMLKAKKLNDIEVCDTVAQTSGGRPGKEFWLDRTQALLVATQSDTPRAWALTTRMVKVFERVMTKAEPPQRRTELVPIDPTEVYAARRREVEGALDDAIKTVTTLYSMASSEKVRVRGAILEHALGLACVGGTGREMGYWTESQFLSIRSAILGVRSIIQATATATASRRVLALPSGKRKSSKADPRQQSFSLDLDLGAAMLRVSVEPKQELS